MIALALVVALLTSATGAVDDGAAFRAAYGSIDRLEALGAARPSTRWTDDAWYEAAQLAERAGDFDRARRDYEAALAVATDPQLARRARGMRDRLDAITGGGRWTEVAQRHEALATQVRGDGEPQEALAGLEAIVRDHPAYPRVQAVRVLLAQAWEREGEPARALAWLRAAIDAAPEAERPALRFARVGVLVRSDDLDGAEAEAMQLGRPDARTLVATARSRRTWLRLLLALVLALGALAVLALRREAGSWRSALRRLWPPPFEVGFLVPIGAVLVLVARTGNPLVARAVLVVAVAGAAVSWISGALLGGRPRRGPRILLHAVLSLVAVAACAYLAVDHARLIDLLGETWRSGPAPP